MTRGIILYLRTDIADKELTSGGSVAHTLGVMQGFSELGFEIVCASSCLDSVLKKTQIKELIKLSNPPFLSFLRWKLNCLLSTIFFFFQARTLCKKYPISCIYQRYSLLNMTGLLLSWWYNKKLILEYNGSEAWIAYKWAEKKRLLIFKKAIYAIESFILKKSNFVIVVSQVLKDELIKRGVCQKKIICTPNGVDIHIFSQETIKKGVVA